MTQTSIILTFLPHRTSCGMRSLGGRCSSEARRPTQCPPEALCGQAVSPRPSGLSVPCIRQPRPVVEGTLTQQSHGLLGASYVRATLRPQPVWRPGRDPLQSSANQNQRAEVTCRCHSQLEAKLGSSQAIQIRDSGVPASTFFFSVPSATNCKGM